MNKRKERRKDGEREKEEEAGKKEESRMSTSHCEEDNTHLFRQM